MPAAYSALQITDGTITANLVDGTNYQLLERSFPPAIAGRRQLNLAGRGPYVDVVERVRFDVRGADRATTLANLQKLSTLLDYAERWAAGDEISPVKFKIQPQGSTITNPLQAVILGRPPNSAGVILPPDFNDLLVISRIEGVEIQFIRRGLLIDVAESAVTVAAAANPVVQEATFASSAAIPSPVVVRVGGWTDTSHLTIETPSVLFIAAEKEDIFIVQAEAMDTTNWTEVTDTTNDASGGKILRYTAPDTAEHSSDDYEVAAADFNRSTAEIGIYAMIKGHATIDFILQAETTSYVFNSAQRTPPFVVEAGSYTSPTPVYLGSVHQRRGHRFVRLVARALDATGSPTLNIDTLVLVALKPSTHIIQLGEMFLSSPFISQSPSNVRILVDPAPLTDFAPFVGYQEISGEVASPSEADVEYQGDGAVYMAGSTIAVLWYGKRSAKWVDTDASGDPTQVTLNVVRSKGYLTPE